MPFYSDCLISCSCKRTTVKNIAEGAHYTPLFSMTNIFEFYSQCFAGTRYSRNSHCPELYLYIQMELCQQITLKDWLRDKTNVISISKDMSIFLQVGFSNLSLIAVCLYKFSILAQILC